MTSGAPAPLELHASRRGSGPAVVLVHGFTQTGASWGPVAGGLEKGHRVVIVDLPGHGRSPLPPSGSGLEDTALAIAAAGGTASYLGYSLGGRCCLHLALVAPELVCRLVLVSAHPGIEDDVARRRRRRSDHRLAAEIERGGDDGVPAFVDRWMAGPLFAHLSPEQANRPSRLSNSAAGLAASLRTAGTGVQAPLWDRLQELDMSVLLVAGALDVKFAALAERAAAAIGANARLELVKGAGHAVPFERPHEFTELVRDFLSSETPPAG